MITQEFLKKFLRYDPITGKFTRLPGNFSIGGTDGQGYTRILIEGKLYAAHRVAWLYMTGEWPKQLIDHIDRKKSNNKWDNLREVTNAQNLQNREFAHLDSKSGVLGVHYHIRRKKYTSQIQVDGKIKYIGIFNTVEEAQQAYIEAKRKYHPHGTL